MGTNTRPKTRGIDSDFYDDLDDYDDYDEIQDYDDDLIDVKDLSKDFYSTDWEDPSGPESRFDTRRKIERRNDLKALYSQIDDWNALDLGNDW
ncbi:hypothetical protein ACFL3I_01370 [Pseudomonadota bacterium]